MVNKYYETLKEYKNNIYEQIDLSERKTTKRVNVQLQEEQGENIEHTTQAREFSET